MNTTLRAHSAKVQAAAAATARCHDPGIVQRAAAHPAAAGYNARNAQKPAVARAATGSGMPPKVLRATKTHDAPAPNSPNPNAKPVAAADRAASLGVPIYTIALGTPEGRITVNDQFGQPVTLDVPPDTETLDQIAEVTGAQSFDAPSAADLQAVYDNLESRVGYTEEVQEITFLLVAAGLVLVVIGAGASALWFGRLP